MAHPDVTVRRPTILIASYYFPPDAAVGGLRPAKFVRALAELGWVPIVLTVCDEYRDQGLDQERMAGLESVTIVRTRELPRFWKRVRATVSRLIRHGEARRSPADPSAFPVASGGARGETPVRRVKRWIISLGVLLPDDKKHWALPAAFTAIGLIRRRHIDYVLTSGPPFSAHFIGLMAKAFTRVRWIADFRDPWVDMLPERFPHTRSSASDFLERRMEALVAKTADTVVVTTPRMQAAFRTRHASIAPDRFVCITNSIDTATFQACSQNEKYIPLTITYAGSLYFDRTPEPLFQAVSDLLKAGRIEAQDIRIKLVGRCRSFNGADTQGVADRYGLQAVVEVLDPVPYSEAIRMMQKSHLLLVLAPKRHQLVVPAKLYDYLGSGSKILAIAEPGATSDLIEETASGRCFTETEVGDLRNYLEELIENGGFRRLRNDPESFPQYDLRHLTGRLVLAMGQSGPGCADQIAVRG